MFKSHMLACCQMKNLQPVCFFELCGTFGVHRSVCYAVFVCVYKKHLTLIHMAVRKTQHAAVFRPHFSIYFGIFFEHNRSTPWLPRLVYMRGTCCMYAQKNSYVKGFLWR